MVAPFNLLTTPTRIVASRLRVHLTIPGEPVSKQRPRFAVNKNGSVYTPRKTHEAQETIGWSIKAAHRGLLLDDATTFGVRLIFFCKNHQRRDIDNMTKLVFDACTGVVWGDDSQVTELIARVIRDDPEPRTELAIYSLGTSALPPSRACRLCGKSVRIYPSWQDRLYCSRTCSALAARNGIDAVCENCGNPCWRAQYRLHGSKSGLFYCSVKCKSDAMSEELVCAYCGTNFRRPKSLHRSGRTFCGETCMATFWRLHRRSRMPGRCRVCGGGTTRKEYTRCAACKVSQSPLRSPGRIPA